MRYPEILAYVERIGKFKDPGEAEKAIRAVLAAFARRISPKEAHDFASQLPKELASSMDAVTEHEEFRLDEFFERIGEKLGISPAEGMHHAEVVLGVVQEAVDTGELEDFFPELAPEFVLFLNKSAVVIKTWRK